MFAQSQPLGNKSSVRRSDAIRTPKTSGRSIQSVTTRCQGAVAIDQGTEGNAAVSGRTPAGGAIATAIVFRVSSPNRTVRRDSRCEIRTSAAANHAQSGSHSGQVVFSICAAATFAARENRHAAA